MKNLLILRCGDIHLNPGPMPNLLQKHPAAHKRWQTTYFLPSTIIFQSKYQHLAKTFKPFFQIAHTQPTLSLPHLYNYIQQHNNHPPPQIIYATVATISPSIVACNTYLQQQPTQDWTSQLLEKMTKLPNPLERHIDTPHPYTQFRNTHSDKITPHLQFIKIIWLHTPKPRTTKYPNHARSISILTKAIDNGSIEIQWTY